MSPVGDGGGEEDLCHVCSGGHSVTHVPSGEWWRRGGSQPCMQWGTLNDTCSQWGMVEEDLWHVCSGGCSVTHVPSGGWERRGGSVSCTQWGTLTHICSQWGMVEERRSSGMYALGDVFNFVGYQFDLKEGRVKPTPERWKTLTDKIQSILSGPVCPVRQFMSLIGLLTATEKQVHLGRLHLRPIQWHLKNNCRVPESLEKMIPIPKSLHPHLRWWLEESNVLLGQPLHPLKHALQIFTDASKEGWGAHLDEHTARGSWSLPESKFHINHLELKAVFLALKEFRTLCCNKTVLIATDNTTVVAYINKEGG